MRKPRKSIQERFELFHAEHPEVFESYERFTLELIAAGYDRGGSGQVVERIRWEESTRKINPRRDEQFKINDNFTSRYSRLFMEKYPTHRGFFETRKLRRPSATDECGGETTAMFPLFAEPPFTGGRRDDGEDG